MTGKHAKTPVDVVMVGLQGLPPGCPPKEGAARLMLWLLSEGFEITLIGAPGPSDPCANASFVRGSPSRRVKARLVLDPARRLPIMADDD